jgi:hypothetical protein
MTACNDPGLHYEFGVSMFMAGVEAMAAKISQPGNEELARTKHPADAYVTGCASAGAAALS